MGGCPSGWLPMPGSSGYGSRCIAGLALATSARSYHPACLHGRRDEVWPCLHERREASPHPVFYQHIIKRSTFPVPRPRGFRGGVVASRAETPRIQVRPPVPRYATRTRGSSGMPPNPPGGSASRTKTSYPPSKSPHSCPLAASAASRTSPRCIAGGPTATAASAWSPSALGARGSRASGPCSGSSTACHRPTRTRPQLHQGCSARIARDDVGVPTDGNPSVIAA